MNNMEKLIISHLRKTNQDVAPFLNQVIKKDSKFFLTDDEVQQRLEVCKSCIYWQDCYSCGQGKEKGCTHLKREFPISESRLKIKAFKCPLNLWRTPMKHNWAYGITTIPKRFECFEKTLESLKNGGFDAPYIFVDGGNQDDLKKYVTSKRVFNVPPPPLQVTKRWWLALLELYLCEPTCDRYAIFQDDVLSYKNLIHYLDAIDMPSDGYWNLHTMPCNEEIPVKQEGWFKAPTPYTNYILGGCGKGAQGLVFSREAVGIILTSQHLFNKVVDTEKGWKNIDGAVVEILYRNGIYEYLHNPSLIQHVGVETTVPSTQPKHLPPSRKWLGEDFDATSFLTGRQT